MITVDKAAYNTISGVIYSVERPGRHHDIIKVMYESGVSKLDYGMSGFLLSDGKFVDRIEGAALAITNGQIDKLAHPPYLYSEDLW